MLLCMYYYHTPSDKSGDSTGRYHPERRGNLHATGWLLIGRGSYRQHVTRVAPLAMFANLSPPETICSHHQMRNPSILVNSNILGAETEIPRVDSASHGVQTPIPLVDHCVMEPARAGRVVSLANVDVPPHPGRTWSHYRIGKSSISLRPQQPGNRDGDSSGLYRLEGYGKSNLIGWLLSHQEIPRKTGCTSGQFRSPAAPGEDRVSSPGKKCFYVCTISTRPPIKAAIPQVDTARNGVKTSPPPPGCRLTGAHGDSAQRELPLLPTLRTCRTRRRYDLITR